MNAAQLMGKDIDRIDPSRALARRIVSDFLGDRSMSVPNAYKAWLDTGDESLLKAANYASDGMFSCASVCASLDGEDITYSTALAVAGEYAGIQAYHLACSSISETLNCSEIEEAHAIAMDAVFDRLVNNLLEKYEGWMVDFLSKNTECTKVQGE